MSKFFAKKIWLFRRIYYININIAIQPSQAEEDICRQHIFFLNNLKIFGRYNYFSYLCIRFR